MWVFRCPVSILSLETNVAHKLNAFFLMDYTSLLGLIIDGKGNMSCRKTFRLCIGLWSVCSSDEMLCWMFTVMHILILIQCMYNASNSFCTDQESLLKKCSKSLLLFWSNFYSLCRFNTVFCFVLMSLILV